MLRHLAHIVLFLALLCSAEVRSGVYISEIMQSNVYEVLDAVDNFGDSYVEIYNDSDEVIHLLGYSIGITPNYEDSYPMPGVLFEPHTYLMFFPDKIGLGFHPNFRLDSGKGGVYIFKDDVLIDKIIHPKQPCPNISYGRLPSDVNQVGYFANATPGSRNPDKFAEGVVPEVVFSKSGGAWKSHKPFDVALSPAEDVGDCVIRYTTDGSEPTRKSKRYTKPIRVENTTIIRAKCFKDNYALRPSSVQSYIFHGDEITMPVVSLVIDPEYITGEKGLFTLLAQWYRRPLNFEYYSLNNRNAVNQLCEARMGGQNSMIKNPLKSFVLYANKRFGTKRFNHSFWQEMKPNVEAAKSIYLRRSMQPQHKKTAILRDQVAIAAGARYMDSLEYQAFDNVIVYLNGEYYGMNFLYERATEDMLEDNYGIDKDNYDVYKMFGDEWYLSSGEEEEFKKFREFMNSEHTMDEWHSVMNIESFTNLFILQCYVGNWDFIYNNYKMFCNRNDEHPKWSFFSLDCDEAFSKFHSYSFLMWANKDKEQHNLHSLNDDETILFRNIMKNEEFREFFLKHFIAYHGDFLNADNFLSVADSLYDISCNEMQKTIDKHGLDIKPLSYHKRKLDEDIKKRNDFVKYEFRDFFRLGQPVRVIVNKFNENLEDYTLTYDDVSLHNHYFDGIDYEGRTAKITAYSIYKKDFARKWKIIKNVGGKKYEKIIRTKGDTLSLEIKRGVEGYAVYPLTESEDLDDCLHDEELNIGETVEVFDLSGRLVKRYVYLGDKPFLRNGVYIFSVQGENPRSWKSIIW